MSFRQINTTSHGFLMKKILIYQGNKMNINQVFQSQIRRKIVFNELPYEKIRVGSFVEALTKMPDYRDNRGEKKRSSRPS
ncbi:MAG: hypothetical protein D3903_05680 [Candidatus Electrothrix sp. GM3_4]|nr:hypothetical protein [Candidatus Electrothrix sp. GM3_4]